jgi:hypothetical protein
LCVPYVDWILVLGALTPYAIHFRSAVATRNAGSVTTATIRRIGRVVRARAEATLFTGSTWTIAPAAIVVALCRVYAEPITKGLGRRTNARPIETNLAARADGAAFPTIGFVRLSINTDAAAQRLPAGADASSALAMRSPGAAGSLERR